MSEPVWNEDGSAFAAPQPDSTRAEERCPTCGSTPDRPRKIPRKLPAPEGNVAAEVYTTCADQCHDLRSHNPRGSERWRTQ